MTDPWPFGELAPGRYGAILADPPWAYQLRTEAGYEKSPEAQYGTMRLDAICALPVQRLAARDCLLFLWTTFPHMPQALLVMTSWGFRYSTGGAWVKRRPEGRPGFGTGFVLRSATEPFLIGVRGAPRIGSRRVRNLIELAPAIDALRREHSRKPAEARDMLMALRPGVPTCELFAREPWPGADVWGDEADRFG